MARAVGLVGHLLEEMRDPVAAGIWHDAEEDVLAAQLDHDNTAKEWS